MGMRIGIDIDGVVYPFVEALRNCLVADGYQEDDFPEPTTWKFGESWGFTNAGLDRLITKHSEKNPHMLWNFERGEVRDVHAVKDMISDGHEIHFITARNHGSGVHLHTVKWLYESGFQFHGLHFEKNKKNVNLDVLIDDGMHNFHAGQMAMLVDRPWNKSAGMEPHDIRFNRVEDLTDALVEIRDLGAPF